MGAWGFHDVEVLVEAPLLVPRPETEELVDLVAAWWGSDGPARFADAGCGTGCLGLALLNALPAGSSCVAVDVSPKAVAVSTANAARLGYFFCLAVGTCYVGARRADLGEVSPVGGQQAVLAPVFASFTLGGLYLLIKNTELDPATVYRGVACVFALLSGVELLQPLFGLLASGEPLRPVSAPPLNSRREEAVMRAGAAPALATAAALVVLYLQGPISTGGTLTLPTFAFVNNYLAWSITTVTLGVVSLESFAAGAILLIGLFCYDAFFVFQSDVMITAA